MPETRSGSRLIRRWRVLVAHDASSPTCDALIRGVERVLQDPSAADDSPQFSAPNRGVELVDCSSVDDACAALEAGSFDLCLVCLDLPPVPHGGVRLANLVLDVGNPLLLVTRSLRWLPASAESLRSQAWVRPEVDDDALRRAIAAAVSSAAASWPAAPSSDAAAVAGDDERFQVDRIQGDEDSFDGEFDADDPRSGSRPSFPGIFTLGQEGLVQDQLLPEPAEPGLARGSMEPEDSLLEPDRLDDLLEPDRLDDLLEPDRLDDDETDAGLERTSQVG